MADNFNGIEYLYENPGEELHQGDGGAFRLKVDGTDNLFDQTRVRPSVRPISAPVAGLGGTEASPMAAKQMAAKTEYGGRKPTPEELQQMADEMEDAWMAQQMQPSAVEPALRRDAGNPEIPSWLQEYMSHQPTTGTNVVDRYGTNKYLTEQEKQKYRLQPWKRQ